MTIESTRGGALTRGQTVFMVAALVLSVASFMLNATMLAPAIRDINTHLGHNAFGPISSYFYLAGATGNVVLIRWSDYIGRKRVLIGVLLLLCVGTGPADRVAADRASYHSALWIALAIGIVALVTSLILKPRTAESGLTA
jgi:MFS family permease